MESSLEYIGCLSGHSDWVTSIAAPPDNSDIIVSASRDKSVLVWNLSDANKDQHSIGSAKTRLTGHNRAVNDVAVSSDGSYVVSGSCDKTLRLFDVNAGKSVRNFVGHTSDVFSVALSPDNRQIISGSRDHTIKVWNAMGVCMYTLLDGQHNDWVSCVRFSPSPSQPLFVSCGWDKIVKVWSHDFKPTCNLVGHSSVLYTVTIAPDGSLCASGGKDGVVMLWDVGEGKHLYSLDANHSINALCFSPCNYWLCAATDKCIRIWELEHKLPVAEFAPPAPIKNGLPWCVSLTWSNDGKTLFAGSTDSNIYVYKVKN